MHLQQTVARQGPAPACARQAGPRSRWAARSLPQLQIKNSASIAKHQRTRALSVRVSAAAGGGGAVPPTVSTVDESLPDVSEVARQNLERAANACRRYGWLSFWVQLVLTTIATVILLFSMAFTSQARAGGRGGRERGSRGPTGPTISLYLTLFGIVLGFLSTFWAFGYTRLSNKLHSFLEAGTLDAAPKVKRSDVINMLEKAGALWARGAIINVLGAGAAMVGLQATIGLLVAKTLTSATVNPFLASTTTSWNPVLAFDVFNVQATTNALLSHFFSLVSSLWLLRIIANRPSATAVVAKSSKAVVA
eukprot:scaffold1.g5182.t1